MVATTHKDTASVNIIISSVNSKKNRILGVGKVWHWIMWWIDVYVLGQILWETIYGGHSIQEVAVLIFCNNNYLIPFQYNYYLMSMVGGQQCLKLHRK